MSDYVNPFADITLESLMQDEPPSIESMLQKEEDQNWDDLFDWDTYNFGAYVQQTTTESRQRGNRTESSAAGTLPTPYTRDRLRHTEPHLMEAGPLESPSAPANPNDNQPVIVSAGITSEFVCHAPGCRLKSFKRRAELARHELKHAGTRNFSCPGWDCSKAFTRKDKLVDHIRAGHDADALFVCPKPDCEETFTKDVLPLHIQEFAYVQKYRKCPMPRCKFCIADVRSQSLDVMQAHLLEGHDALGRRKFAGVLALGGYHYEDVEILCPICPEANLFKDHGDFYAHFLIQHRPRRRKSFARHSELSGQGLWQRSCDPCPT